MCFGGGGDGGSREMIQMQKDEAAEARAKEVARQDRINSGLERIKQAFEGAPVMGTRQVMSNYDWNQKGAGLPAGYTYTAAVPGTGGTPDYYTPGTPATATSAATPGKLNVSSYRENVARSNPNIRIGGRDAGNSNAYGGGGLRRGVTNTGQVYTANRGGFTPATNGYWSGGSAATPGSDEVITGPDGKIYRKGEQTPFDEQYDTGQRTGGIGEDFYNKFKQGIVDYYSPQVAEQYEDAKKQTKYGFARARTLRSGAATTAAAKLAKDKTLRDAEVFGKGDTAAGDLRNRIASERAKAESQLYATENPDVAVNQALSAITNITAEEPELTPLGSMFEVATIGGANALKGIANTRLGKVYVPGYGTANRNQNVVGAA